MVQVDSSTLQGGTLNTLNGGTMQTVGYAYLDGSTGAGAINLSSGSTYTTANNAQTFILGTINNQGTFQQNGGGNTNAYLYLNGNTTLQGGGAVNLSTTTTGGGGNAYLWQNGGYTLTNVDNTIQGEGVIYNNGAVLNNQATINANSTGGALIPTLTLEYGTVNNTGLLEATNSGDLQLYSTTVNNTGGGTITANGLGGSGTMVQVDSSTIQGGTLNNNTGGTMQTVGYAYLYGSTGAGAINLSSGSTYTTANNAETFILGTINNQGTFQQNGGGNTNAYLYLNGNTTLQGGGAVNLSTTTTGGGGNAYLWQNGGYTLTNVDNTIQGEGVIYNNGAVLNNQATINANSTGGALIPTLTLEYGTVNNTGLLEANNTGGGTITANGLGGSGTMVQVDSSTLQGGTLNTLNGGTMQTVGYAYLDGSTGAGAINLSSGSTYTTANNAQTF